MTAVDGQEALDMVETYHPHLMVTDVVMPRMNGYELVRRVRQHPGFRQSFSCQDETRLRNEFKVTRPEPISISPSHLRWELGAAVRNL